MGMAHIIWVHEDGIERSLRSNAEWVKLGRAVGDAVLQVSLSRHHTRGDREVNSASVLNSGDCVNHCDHGHSTDSRLYYWGSNCLRRLDQLEDDEFTVVESIVADERKRRASTQ